MKTFLVSRTDAIGDVVLTLPLCGWIKEACPGARVIFLGRPTPASFQLVGILFQVYKLAQGKPPVTLSLNWR
jgi:hypothetical protein